LVQKNRAFHPGKEGNLDQCYVREKSRVLAMAGKPDRPRSIFPSAFS
jgi:hypothetical protein